MADALNQELQLCEIPYGGLNVPTSSSLNSAARMVAGVHQVQESVTITRGYVYLNTKTGTLPTYRISLQSLNTSGQPSGTVLGGGSPASATFDANSWTAGTGNWVNFANSYTASAGEFLAVVVDYSSGTVDASNFCSIYYVSGIRSYGLPYALDYTASWAKVSGIPILSYGSSGTTYGFPYQGHGTVSLQSTGTIEAGTRFTLPSWSGTCTLKALRVLLSPGAGTTYSVKLYSGGGASDTTAIATVSGIDGDFSASANRVHTIYFSNPPTLTFGNTYRISVVADGSTANVLWYANFAQSGDLSPCMMGTNAYYTTRSGGNWTDTNTRKCFMSLLLGDISPASGSAGARLVGPSALVSA